ncbi:hypothetical protein [Blautia pseudococcoides]|nr:hypothetical protein [Blautia pseudococcoides]
MQLKKSSGYYIDWSDGTFYDRVWLWKRRKYRENHIGGDKK